jgi:microcystin-dependent protein
MASPYVGEIRMFAGSFAPLDWAFCDGRLMAISENPTLYNLIGTTYGGDGVQTFALPDLQGRLPLHAGNGFVQGEKSGEETHTLNVPEIPNHSHTVSAKGQATTNSIAGGVYAGGGLKAYKAATAATMNPAVVQSNSGGQPHENLMPFVVVSFIIALAGVYPTQS